MAISRSNINFNIIKIRRFLSPSRHLPGQYRKWATTSVIRSRPPIRRYITCALEKALLNKLRDGQVFESPSP